MDLDLRTRLVLRPGAAGTKRLMHQYGESLVRVRYRYDNERRLRYKTVELVVEITQLQRGGGVVDVRVRAEETSLAALIEQHGATRSSDEIWRVPYDAAVMLDITGRIVPATPSTSADRQRV